jgi:hypothetical protein
VNGWPSQRITFPIGSSNPINSTADSFKMKALESDANSGEKSRPSFISQPMVFRNHNLRHC